MRKKSKRVKHLAKALDEIEDYLELSLVISVVIAAIFAVFTMIIQFFSELIKGRLRKPSAVIEVLGLFLTLTLIFSLSSGPIRRLEGKKVFRWIIAAATVSLIGSLLTSKFNPLQSPVKGAKTYAVFLVMFLAVLLAYVVVDRENEESMKDIIS